MFRGKLQFVVDALTDVQRKASASKNLTCFMFHDEYVHRNPLCRHPGLPAPSHEPDALHHPDYENHCHRHNHDYHDFYDEPDALHRPDYENYNNQHQHHHQHHHHHHGNANHDDGKDDTMMEKMIR